MDSAACSCHLATRQPSPPRCNNFSTTRTRVAAWGTAPQNSPAPAIPGPGQPELCWLPIAKRYAGRKAVPEHARPVLLVCLARSFGGAEVRVLQIATALHGLRSYCVATL